MSDFNQQVIAEFRANAGQVGGFFADKTVLLLHTTGAKSGLPRITPLVSLADGDRHIVCASSAGAAKHPHWYHNLVAHPNVTVEIGSEQFAALATPAAEPERSTLYARMEARYPFFTEYAQKAANRTIPVILLTRQAP